jgi:uncharacterized protein YndB with AHSA1/START domain
MAASTTSQNEKDIVITREFAAPRQLVWDVWTKPEHVEKWFGPKGFSTRVDQFDFKVGGRTTYVMIGPDGKEYPSTGVYQEIVPIEKIVTTDEFGEEFETSEGVNKDDLPQGMLQTYLFEDLNNRTKLTIITSHPTLEDKQKHEAMGVVEGWNSTLDKAEEYLAELQK